ncbi:hypothetical protein KR084_006933 [Drosophila pseudotakahashii]|nr:hypothetical protein KR084_006933 [Drosophila pseudotakahashii]
MNDRNEQNQDKGDGQESSNEFKRPSAQGAQGGRQPPPSRYIQTTEDNKDTTFEKCAVTICMILVVITFPLSMCCCLTTVNEYTRIIILRLGRLKWSFLRSFGKVCLLNSYSTFHRKGVRGPGLVFFLPCIDDIHRVDMRTAVANVSPQDVLTKDSVTITVNAVVYYSIYSPIDSIIQVDDAQQATELISQVTLRNIVGSKTLHVLLTSRQQLSREIQQAVAGITARWGVRVERVDVMDIILPSSLERSLASEAEAVREARAKIILAEGELKASKALKEASDVMSQNRITLQLRHLQILSSIATERRVRIIYPIPLEIMEPFMSGKESQKNKKDGGDDGAGGSKETRKEEGEGGGAGGSKETRKEGGAHGVLSNFFFSGKEETKPNIKEDAQAKDPNEPGSAKSVVLNLSTDERRKVRTDEQNQRPTCKSM